MSTAGPRTTREPGNTPRSASGGIYAAGEGTIAAARC
uniref:Uncharacterized protein n=1 Tax=Arundo donax TaxID=35708 RepID=A0A0A9HQ85_ARUDO